MSKTFKGGTAALAAVLLAASLLPIGLTGCTDSGGSRSSSGAPARVAAPTADPAAGTISTGHPISLVSATAGAAIYYTTDGTVPTARTGKEYSSPFTLSTLSATVKAIAIKEGMADSTVLRAKYVLTGAPAGASSSPVAAPTASPDAGAISSGQLITLGSTTDGATIYYTTDGSEPNGSSTEYTAPITLPGLSADPTTVKAIAVKANMIDSTVLSAAYTLAVGPAQVDTPTASPDAGAIASGQAITLATTTDGATIYYTTNGTTPTASPGNLYSGAFTLPGLSAAPTTVKAIAVKASMTNSAVLSAAYTLALAGLTGTVSVDGTLEVGYTLTANTASLDGSGAISYQWKRGNGGVKDAITGANSATYLLAAEDVGKVITVEVTRSGNSGSVTGEQKNIHGHSVVVVGTKDLSIKLGARNSVTISMTPALVTATFNAVHDLIQGGGTWTDQIALGNYIDLPSLTVLGYGGTTAEFGAFSHTANTDLDGHGTLLRLIVVGRNSFRNSSGTADGSNPFYDGAPNQNEALGHVVFQFANIPGTRRMDAPFTTVNGYADTEMRKYLVPITGDADSGNYLRGLTLAGVPEDKLWAPTRFTANAGGTDKDSITDLLWLPTEWEMHKINKYSKAALETRENQTQFMYYQSNVLRKKYAVGNSSGDYWEASFDHPLYGCTDRNGATGYGGKSDAKGVAPAFCVK